MENFDQILDRYEKLEVFNYLTSLSAKLSNENETKSIQESDYLIYLSQLNQLVEKANIPLDTKRRNPWKLLIPNMKQGKQFHSIFTD